MTSAGTGRGLQLAVLGSMVLGGYWLLRGRHRFEPLSDNFEFERAATTRHMVDLKRRVDKERIAHFLQQVEQEEGPGKREGEERAHKGFADSQEKTGAANAGKR